MKNKNQHPRSVDGIDSPECKTPGLCAKLRDRVSQIKERLFRRYEQLAPHRSGFIRAAIADAESQAWKTPFPHLFFPDLVEIRLAPVIAGSNTVHYQRTAN